MSETSLRRNPVEELAEDFLNRYRRGERPSISEYARRHPELAGEILDVFPSLAMMEEAGAGAAGSAPASVPERLGDYRILREVGRGGMGVVYEAVQESLGRHVALKVLPPEASLDRVRRFRHEARSAARLHHTNIVPVFEVGEHGGTNYYAMQFIQGQSLDEVMRELRRLRADRQTAAGETPAQDEAASQPLSAELARALANRPAGNLAVKESGDVSRPTGPAPGCPPPAATEGATRPEVNLPSPCGSTEALRKSPSSTSELTSQSDSHYYRSVARIGVQVAEALAYANAQKVLHRDIKPSNLLLDLQGTAWVTDFGLAKEEGDDLTQTGDLVGTLRFMAPERFHGAADARSDIYSLGLTLYEMLALRAAFDEADRGRLIRQITQSEPVHPRAIDRHVPRDMETIVLKAIAKEPSRRYQAASDMAEDLRRFLSDRPVLARRTSPWEQTWRWCRRNRLVASLATLVVMLLATVATVSSVAAWRLNDEQEALRQQLFLTQEAEKVAEQRAEQIRLAAERQHATDALIQSAGLLADFDHWREANQALQQAVLLRPDSSLARHERGLFYGRLGLWEMAAKDLADGFRWQAPDHPRLWLAHGLLRAYVRDEPGYRDHQGRLDKRFRQFGTFFSHENELVRAGTLMSCSPDMATWLAEVARQAVNDEPHLAYSHYSLGLALYRQGDYDGSLAAFEESLRVGGHWANGGLAHTGIALCRHHLGQASEARQSLARAAKVIDDAAAAAVHLRPGRCPLGLWHDWLECVVRFRDANLEIEGSSPPENAGFLMFRARALAAIGETDLAVAACRRALALAPDDVSLRRACLGVLADLGPAQADFARETEPNQEDVKDQRTGLAIFLKSVLQGNWEQATADCDTLRQRWPDDVDLHLACGDAYLRRARWAEAIAGYTVVIELPDDKAPGYTKRDAFLSRGRAYAMDNRRREATDDLTAALLLAGDDSARAMILFERAEQYYLDDKTEMALADLDGALEIEPNAPAVQWGNRGAMHGALKHWELALADFNRAIEGDPKIWWFWSWRGHIQREFENWDAAVADCSRAIELFPLNTATWYNRGAAYSARAEWEPAVADYTRSAELGETDPPLFLRRAQALVQLHRFSEAASDYKTYLAAKPDDSGAWFQAVVVHVRLGEDAAAHDAYDRGLSLIDQTGPADEPLRRQRAAAERALAEAAAGGRISPAAMRIPLD